MFLLYTDESGDSGQINSPTKHFILSGLVIHESKWIPLLDDLVTFRRNLLATKGLKMKEEIHAVEFITRPGELVRIPKNDRLDILKKCIDWLASRNELSIITIVIDKDNVKNGKDIFELAWERLIQRFENTIQYKNFPDSQINKDDKGMILSDNTDNRKLTELMRRMRRYNPIPNRSREGYRNVALTRIIEDPVMKDSAKSYINQMVDVIAYFARQHFEPNAYIRKKGATTFYKRLLPILNPKVSSLDLHFVKA